MPVCQRDRVESSAVGATIEAPSTRDAERGDDGSGTAVEEERCAYW
jgi:hypothetical protein